MWYIDSMKTLYDDLTGLPIIESEVPLKPMYFVGVERPGGVGDVTLGTALSQPYFDYPAAEQELKYWKANGYPDAEIRVS